MSWLYQGKIFTSEQIQDNIGFTYCLTDRINGKRYFGKKLLVTTRKLPPLKGSKRSRRKVIETDWQDYWSSSDTIKALILEHGTERFSREILTLCKTKGQLSYEELRLQVMHDVLSKPDEFYNAFIGCKIHRNHIYKKSSF